MEKFEGNGAECLLEYVKNGCVGKVLRHDKLDLTDVINRHFLKPEYFLTAPCTYTPPEPVWKECTAGEALDAWMNGKIIQLRNFGKSEWYNADPGEYIVPWIDKTMYYRKEV